MKFKGYRRPDGKVGIRNYVLLLPTSICSNKVAAEIAGKVKGCTTVDNTYGCCQVGSDYDLTFRTMVNLAKHPNVGAVIVVGLGCEGLEPLKVYNELKNIGKPVAKVVIQEEGGTLKTFARGCQIAREYTQLLSQQERVECDISDLILGIECGGSDTTSGLASNPASGAASDLLIAAGGTSILSETTELIGAEHVLARRAINQQVADKLIGIVNACEKRAKDMGQDIRGTQPTPGNIEGGITTIEEKSLGCIHKAGSAPVQGVLEYGEIPQGRGLYVMDTPGQDIVSISGMVAGGAQVVIFTTGRGTPTGNPIAPVIKITGNKRTYEKMKDNIDIEVAEIIEGTKSIKEMGQVIFEEIIKVANGKTTKAEELDHNEFSIYRIGPTF
ncbi:MAG: altronate dehydratase large subunit [Clostridia bacterium]|nr:altronate dehydratase large subunit [Clostridia bacterium]MDN5322226.1 altronate dehydratase large subunit [Clostridia bacterium]